MADAGRRVAEGNKASPHRPPARWIRVAGTLAVAAAAAVAVYEVSTTATSAYQQAISYTRRELPFTPRRTIDVSSASELKAAIANLGPGDLVKATASFTVSGQSVIKTRLTAPAVIDLTGYDVRFVYSGGQAFNAVWLDNPKNIRIYGGDMSTADSGGDCLSVYGGQRITWWYFTAHDCGGTGAQIATVTAPSQQNDFEGTIWSVGHVLARDPHREKGSGIHCVNLDDSGQFAFRNNRFAFYCHDIPTGAAVEYGSRGIPPIDNTIYLKAVDLSFVSKQQTGGNAIQFWGVNRQSADIKYLEVVDAEGYALYDGGMYRDSTLSGVTVEYGRATDTDLNPRYAGQDPWQTDKAVVYKDVNPAP
jgi:hypothetical protein